MPQANMRPRLWRQTDTLLEISLPADLAAFVLFLKPTHQRFEVLHHRASGNVFAGRFLQDFAPIFDGAFFQDVIKHRRCRRLKLLRFREKESRRRPTDLTG